MKSFIGSHYIEKHSVGSSEKYTAFQIVDYVGRDHILVEEEGWAIANTKSVHPERSMMINADTDSTHKTSIITIGKFIKNQQDDVICLFFHENEVKNKLAALSKDLHRYLKNQDYTEWIEALTREFCKK